MSIAINDHWTTFGRGDSQVPAEKKGLAVAKHRLQAFQVQEGAATGRSGRSTGRQGAGMCRVDGMMG